MLKQEGVLLPSPRQRLLKLVCVCVSVCLLMISESRRVVGVEQSPPSIPWTELGSYNLFSQSANAAVLTTWSNAGHTAILVQDSEWLGEFKHK